MCNARYLYNYFIKYFSNIFRIKLSKLWNIDLSCAGFSWINLVELSIGIILIIIYMGYND